jgi:hypothetical protein
MVDGWQDTKQWILGTFTLKTHCEGERRKRMDKTSNALEKNGIVITNPFYAHSYCRLEAVSPVSLG